MVKTYLQALQWDKWNLEKLPTTLLSSVGGLFFFNCNYNISNYTIPSQFYREHFWWWSQFRETFATEEDWKTIIWNNKEIKVENKPVYYKHYVNARVICIQDLLFSLNSTDSYNQLSKKICKTNILEWAGLRRFIVKKLWQVSFHKLSNICGGWQ